MNRERDKDTAIFSFLNYSHKTVKLSHVAIYAFICIYSLEHIFYSSTFSFILFFFIAPSAWMLLILCEANQLLISLLAIQRILLHLLPRYEKHLQVSENGMKTMLYLFFILDIFYTVYLFKLRFNDEVSTVRIQLTVDIALYSIVLISALLYIPILISIRKVKYLVSVQENQPQRYIAWQIIVIFVEKVICGLLFIVSIVLNPTTTTECDPEDMIYLLKLHESFLMPLVIEVTYIGCNRRNFLTALTSLKSWRGFKAVFCPWIRATQVEPTGNLAVISSTNMELRAAAVQN
ncbi:hypothetical protein CAEBREN_17669 [Caenorhabditis brenneri]|uniref:Uncharacterized protein n=1 Tax=Caenorhabditis brenneri TaxID=135651 RepID=G0NJC8_CAEBE|nr:hypothetical protein CAEBREN_17669 [Caenorhabditis brenneri]